ncbi:MAG TPA: pyridoxal 5'-phosphate synthase lyase subunit PdxS [Planctomycetes bacterium]|nr:pyridoxal 5'-phosphate synthase lyase subunit PdxS [Planctomycetota bacterium]
MNEENNIAVEGENNWEEKVGLAKMLVGGVVMDVTNAEQARIAEQAGAVAVMALERVPSDIRKDGGIARMSPVSKIQEIQKCASIPVMAKSRIGHFMEAEILEALSVDFIDESEVLTPADEDAHIDKSPFKAPFVCGARNLGEALRRISEGAALIRTKGEAGTGDIIHAVRHMKLINSQIEELVGLGEWDLAACAEKLNAPRDLVKQVAKDGRLPVPNFAAGGIATPADAAMMMRLGAEAVFVGSGIFKSSPDPEKQSAVARAIVEAVTHFDNPAELVRICQTVDVAMRGEDTADIPEEKLLQSRGW